MIKKAKNISRYQRKKMNKLVRGIYCNEEDDIFDCYLIRYPTGVISLRSALSYYSIIDEWITPPFDMVFQVGYRKIKDDNIRQFIEKKEILLLGTRKVIRNNIEFLIYNKERLLLEVFRKEKYLSLEDYKQAIFHYRQLANEGKLNIPLLKQYISQVPKSNIYLRRLLREVL